jgi:hypothetical protein
MSSESLAIMRAIWTNGPERQSDRMVLLVLANEVRDKGAIVWPGMARICERACMSERGAQAALKRLEADGFIDIFQGGGRGRHTRYHVKNPQQVRGIGGENPAVSAVINTRNPAAETPQPVRGKPLNPAARAGNDPKNPADRAENPAARAGETPRNLLREEEESARESVNDFDALDDDDLLAEAMAAAGHRNGQIPTYWMPPAATIHVGRWRRDLGLTGSQIIEEIRNSAARHSEKASGPKAFDRRMQILAGELSAAPMQPAAPTKPRDWKGERERNADLDFFNSVIRRHGT